MKLESILLKLLRIMSSSYLPFGPINSVTRQSGIGPPSSDQTTLCPGFVAIHEFAKILASFPSPTYHIPSMYSTFWPCNKFPIPMMLFHLSLSIRNLSWESKTLWWLRPKEHSVLGESLHPFLWVVPHWKFPTRKNLSHPSSLTLLIHFIFSNGYFSPHSTFPSKNSLSLH